MRENPKAGPPHTVDGEVLPVEREHLAGSESFREDDERRVRVVPWRATRSATCARCSSAIAGRGGRRDLAPPGAAGLC